MTPPDILLWAAVVIALLWALPYVVVGLMYLTAGVLFVLLVGIDLLKQVTTKAWGTLNG